MKIRLFIKSLIDGISRVCQKQIKLHTIKCEAIQKGKLSFFTQCISISEQTLFDCGLLLSFSLLR